MMCASTRSPTPTRYRCSTISPSSPSRKSIAGSLRASLQAHDDLHLLTGLRRGEENVADFRALVNKHPDTQTSLRHPTESERLIAQSHENVVGISLSS